MNFTFCFFVVLVLVLVCSGYPSNVGDLPRGSIRWTGMKSITLANMEYLNITIAVDHDASTTKNDRYIHVWYTIHQNRYHRRRQRQRRWSALGFVRNTSDSSSIFNLANVLLFDAGKNRFEEYDTSMKLRDWKKDAQQNDFDAYITKSEDGVQSVYWKRGLSTSNDPDDVTVSASGIDDGFQMCLAYFVNSGDRDRYRRRRRFLRSFAWTKDRDVSSGLACVDLTAPLSASPPKCMKQTFVSGVACNNASPSFNLGSCCAAIYAWDRKGCNCHPASFRFAPRIVAGFRALFTTACAARLAPCGEETWHRGCNISDQALEGDRTFALVDFARTAAIPNITEAAAKIPGYFKEDANLTVTQTRFFAGTRAIVEYLLVANNHFNGNAFRLSPFTLTNACEPDEDTFQFAATRDLYFRNDTIYLPSAQFRSSYNFPKCRSVFQDVVLSFPENGNRELANLVTWEQQNPAAMCKKIQANCVGSNKQYNSVAECTSFISGLPRIDPDCKAKNAAFAGMSQACRWFHHHLTRFAPELHCFYVGNGTRPDANNHFACVSSDCRVGNLKTRPVCPSAAVEQGRIHQKVET